MNKLILSVLMVLFLVVVASSASAVSIYEYWPNGSFDPGTFVEGEDVTFEYSSLGPGPHLITTDIFLYEADYSNLITHLVDTSGMGGSYDSVTFPTAGHEVGEYVLYGIAIDTATGYQAETELFYELVPAQTNTAPYFVNLPTNYSFDLAQSNYVFVVDLADYAYDDENDDLDYILDESNTNFNIANCLLQDESKLYCNLNGEGLTEVDVQLYDGDLYSEVETININVYDSTPTNTAPYFVNLPNDFTYELDVGYNQFVIDLALYAYDAETPVDDLSYLLYDSMTNPDVVTCDLVDETKLYCTHVGVGDTQVGVQLFDGELYSDIEILNISIYEEVVPNTAPYFVNLQHVYTYYDLGITTIVDLSLHGWDNENDPLTYDFDMTNTNTDIVSACSLLNGEVLRCVLSGYGETTVDVSVSDYEYTTTETLTIEVIDDTPQNTAPYFDPDMQLYYSYNINLNYVQVVDLAQWGRDDENDPLTYDLDESNTNFNVADCVLILNKDIKKEDDSNFISSVQKSLVENVCSPLSALGVKGICEEDYAQPPNFDTAILACELNGVGTTTVDVGVSDAEFTTWETITINVYEETVNHAPYFHEKMPLEYSYDIVLGSVQVVNLADWGIDPDNDPITFGIDTELTNPDVATCMLIPPTKSKLKDNFIVNTINDLFNIEDDFNTAATVVFCNLNGVGTTTVDVSVSDYEFTTWETLTIHVYDNGGNNTPPYFVDLESYYEYPLSMDEVDVVDLSLHGYDDEGDDLTYFLDDSMTDPDVVVCELISTSPNNSDLTVLHCDLIGVGTTTLEVGVYDGEFTTWETITIHVYDDNINHAPYFVNLTTHYEYDIDLVNVDVVNLGDHGFDPDGDTLTYSLDTTNTNSDVVVCELIAGPTGTNDQPLIINCDLIGVGTTTLVAVVSDGDLTGTQTLVISVYDDNSSNNTAPYFDETLPLYYEYDIDLVNVDVVDLAPYAHDDEFDVVSFSIDTTNTDPNVVVCSLVESNATTDNPYTGPSVINCDLIGVGTTTLVARVTDGQLSSWVTLTIHVYDDGTNNTAPYFIDLELYYEYDIDFVNVDVVKLANHGFDLEGDILSYSLDDSLTDPNIVSCQLLTVPTPTPVNGPSLLNCDLNGVGTTTVKVGVSDGEFTTWATITIRVFDEIVTVGPVAVISSPPWSGVYENMPTVLNGEDSYSPSGLNIVSYDWAITDVYGNVIYTASQMVQDYTFTETGQFYVYLTVTDELGQTDTDYRLIKSYELPEELDEGDAENGLKIRSYGIHGFDFERAYVDGDIMIVAEVENQAGVDLDNVRMTFTIPEFGVRFKSHAVDIDEGDREYMVIYAYVPYFVEEGVYYPYISFSDGDIRRVKTAYLEVYQ